MRARLHRKRIRLHNEDDLDDPWGTFDWAGAMTGYSDASDMGGPQDGRDDPNPAQSGTSSA